MDWRRAKPGRRDVLMLAGPPPAEGSRTPGWERWAVASSQPGRVGWEPQADRDSDGWGGLFRHIPCSFPPTPPGLGELLPLPMD